MSVKSKKNRKRKDTNPPGAYRFPVRIESLNEKAEGIGYHDRIKVTVKKVLPGEEVMVRYDPGRPRKDRIRMESIIKPSTLRQTPPCPYFDTCGGCHLQHLDYQNQLELKANWLAEIKSRYPELKEIGISPVTGVPDPTHYRNKTQLPFRNQDGSVIYGLYHQGTHDITPIDYCLVENREANRVLQLVREWAEKYQIPVYDEDEFTGLLRYVVVRRGQFTNQLMVVIVSREKGLPHWQELVRELKQGLPILKSVILNIQPEKSNVILGEENIVIWGEPFIKEQLGRIHFRIYPATFFQTNSVQTVRMLEKLVREVNLKKTDTVADVYCGVGTIGLYLASRVKQVVGLDSNPESITAAVQNAEDNNVTNAKFYQADVENGILNSLGNNIIPNIIVLDPPRRGLSAELISDINQLKSEQLIYISCNPKTLMRDLAVLTMNGYRAQSILPFDMFPQTLHLESVVHLVRTG